MSDDGDIANFGIQVKNSLGLPIGAFYYFTMTGGFGVLSEANVGAYGRSPSYFPLDGIVT